MNIYFHPHSTQWQRESQQREMGMDKFKRARNGALLALCGVACTGVAQAQQSYLMSRMALLPEYGSGTGNTVRLYGTVDMGAMYANTEHGDSRWQLQSGGVQTSKLGFYAQEALGGGWKAEMKLESGFNADTGTQQTSALFNRESWVGLKSAQWGTLRLGNQINAMLPLYIDPFGLVTTNSVYAWVAGGAVQNSRGVGYNTDLGTGTTTIPVRVPKSVTYTSPRIAGVQAQGIYATNTSGTTNPQVGTRGGVVSYIRGPFYLAASLIQAWGTPVTLSVGAAPEAVRTDIPSAGVIFDNGRLVLSASLARIKPRLAQDGEAKLSTLGAILPQGRLTWRASAVYRDTERARDTAGNLARSAALGMMAGVDYELSPRTALYGRAALLRNFGASTIIYNSVTLPLVAGTTTPQTGIDTRSLSFGLYHHF
jgi:predicted porin